MGIKQLLPTLKGLQGTYGSFLEPHFKGVRIALDAAGLLHRCARRHLSAYEAKDYGPALAEFQRTMAYNISILYLILNAMNVSVVTKDKPLKAARNDSLYNAMAAKVCQGHFIPFILAPEEDDSQCRFALQGQPPEMIVTGDTDLSSIAGTQKRTESSICQKLPWYQQFKCMEACISEGKLL